MQDYHNSNALAMELLQSCTKLSKCFFLSFDVDNDPNLRYEKNPRLVFRFIKGRRDSRISPRAIFHSMAYSQVKLLVWPNVCGWVLSQVPHHDTMIALRPRQNGRHLPDDIFKCIFLMKMYEFRLRFHWSLFLGVQTTISQHWFR